MGRAKRQCDGRSFGRWPRWSVGFDEIASSLRHMKSPRGRGALLQSKEGILFIDESYNASPVSVKAAINNLKAMPWRGRKVAVLGGMRELGGCEKQFHEES